MAGLSSNRAAQSSTGVTSHPSAATPPPHIPPQLSSHSRSWCKQQLFSSIPLINRLRKSTVSHPQQQQQSVASSSSSASNSKAKATGSDAVNAASNSGGFVSWWMSWWSSKPDNIYTNKNGKCSYTTSHCALLIAFSV